jgi:hypothetical protein
MGTPTGPEMTSGIANGVSSGTLGPDASGACPAVGRYGEQDIAAFTHVVITPGGSAVVAAV